ncbi:SAM-dependent methyltransferase [Mycobacterium sp. 852002-50816_SCH5313054-b]|uniref:phthiotriol/phenolphthiotriol dimycocerosates methyltransferase n=1 Tax=Mycobacterium sp. 852002-50816_SCH5313054-b TaxID=1834092 RepID=UPI0007FDC930|nr:class I SAM-dependent methyltransferase [Mycobacterium sp. 852002-50816_SCH5313054-b]OBF58036.1 SAM-dependent methyltransferase [Mycobacterium sp. 852002-50816_SCH5313054-b]
MPATQKSPVRRTGATRLYRIAISKYWYPYMTRRLNGEDVVFLNYGYEEDPPMGIALAACDEPNRLGIQLYHRTAAQADLRGKRVLEVSCGHGGGASYLVRTVHPASYTGLDFNAEAIAYCRSRHDLPGLDFVHGDAENLPFPDESFDAVINIEASHAYLEFRRFIAEVARVLRPGGNFLYADMRSRHDFSAWDAATAATSMRVLSERVINAEVLRGLNATSQRSLDLITRHLPTFLRPFARLFAGVPGSRIYRDLQRGKISYRMYSFAKD